MPRTALFAVAAAALATAGHSPPPSEPAIAAPEVILVYGGSLEGRVAISTFEENHRFMLALGEPLPVPASELDDRQFFSVAMFWGQHWRRAMRSSPDGASLDPARATQHARFYPSQSAAEAVFAYADRRVTSRTRRVGSAALTILARHGVPVAIVD